FHCPQVISTDFYESDRHLPEKRRALVIPIYASVYSGSFSLTMVSQPPSIISRITECGCPNSVSFFASHPEWMSVNSVLQSSNSFNSKVRCQSLSQSKLSRFGGSISVTLQGELPYSPV